MNKAQIAFFLFLLCISIQLYFSKSKFIYFMQFLTFLTPDILCASAIAPFLWASNSALSCFAASCKLLNCLSTGRASNLWPKGIQGGGPPSTPIPPVSNIFISHLNLACQNKYTSCILFLKYVSVQ